MKKGLILLFLVFSCCSCNTNKDWEYPTKFDSKKIDDHGHPYRDVNLNRNLTIQSAFEKDLGDKSAYKVERVLGNGTFGSVFKAIHSPTQDVVALKVLLHSNENVISKEVNILRELQDAPNFLPLRDVLKEIENGEVTIGLVTDYFPGKNFERLLPKLNAYEMKVIVYETMRTIEYAHSKGIMHRDIKPLNVLMIPGGEVRARVIDWGQAEYYVPTRKLGTKVATLYYKAPELLLGYPKYDYSIDVWSTGCMLAEMAFRKYHFFTGDKEVYPRGPDFFSKESKMNFLRGQLDAIASISGTQNIKAYADKFKNDMEDYDMIDYIREHDGTPLASFIDETNFDMVDPLLIDLLYKMLTIDHTTRITMKEALMHPYFDEVRDQ